MFLAVRQFLTDQLMQGFAVISPFLDACISLHSTFVPSCGIFPPYVTHLRVWERSGARALA
jgi:hypothetical protein